MRVDLGLFQALVLATQLGFVLGAAVLIGLLGGAFLDAQLGTRPWFLIFGSLAGLAAGIYSAVQLLKFLLRRAPTRRP